MESSIMRNASRFLREQKKKRKWQKVLACLALVVAAGTTIALIMPGQALNNTEKVLDCQIEVHQHTADCYGEDGTTLICGLADYVAHTHNELCYNEEGELICKLPEMPAHQHTADCYAEERVLTCGLEETPEDGEGIPVSGGDQENAVPHVHTDECYTTVSHLICGQLEAVEHVHTDACFKEVTVDGEKESTDETLNDTEFTDVSPGDLVAAARDEWYFCGKKAHTHSEECYDEEGNLVCGLEEHEHTEDCLKEVVYGCGLEEHTHSYSCYDSEDNLICGMQEHEHDEECIIRYWCGHVTHTHNDACYAGVDVTSGDSAATLNCGLEEHTHTEECLIAPILERVYEDSSIRVTATYPASAMIPEDAEFRVVQITEESDPEHFAERYSDALVALREDSLAVVALLKIGFFLEDETEVEPEEPVTISLEFLDEEGVVTGEPLNLIHFTENGSELMDNMVIEEDGTASFVTDSFSEYMIAGVDSRDEIALIANGSKDIEFDYKKYIDYLGDFHDNTDTSLDNRTRENLDDKYRLYLTMEGMREPVDVLFVIDKSQSMNAAGYDKALYDVLDNGGNGLIDQFLAANPENQVALVYYNGKYSGSGIHPLAYTEGNVLLTWKTASDYTPLGFAKYKAPTYDELNGSGGIGVTNYIAGFFQADAMLKENKTNHQKIVIFLSDGLPTKYYNSSALQNVKTRSSSGWDAVVASRPGKTSTGWVGLTSLIWERRGAGKDASVYAGCKKEEDSPYVYNTVDVFKVFHNRWSNIQFYTVAIGDSFNTKETVNGKEFSRTYTLDKMAEIYGTKTKAASKAADLKNSFEQILFPNAVTITDELSEYANVYMSQPDIKVVAKSKKNPKTEYVLYENGKKVYNAFQTKKNPIIKSVTYDKGKVTVNFVESYSLSPDYTYILSFNVEVTEAAFDKYAEDFETATATKGYPNIGQESTTMSDGGEATSDGKYGFYSNKKATVSYKVDGKTDSREYKHPVVQTWRSVLDIKKVDQGGIPIKDVKFELKYPDGSSVNKVTDADGKLTFTGLKQGSYELFETVPAGYEGGGTVKKVLSFEVSKGRITSMTGVDGDMTQEKLYGICSPADKIGQSDNGIVGNTQTGVTYTYTYQIVNKKLQENVNLQVIKKGENDKLLGGAWFTGAKFEIHKDSVGGELVASGEAANENGVILWDIVNSAENSTTEDSPLLSLPEGNYWMIEVEAPNGYQKPESNSEIHFEVKAEDNKLTIVPVPNPLPKDTFWNLEVPEPIEGDKENTGTFTITVVNEPKKFSLTVKKIDGLDAALAGAEFAVYKEGDTSTLIATGKSAENSGQILWDVKETESVEALEKLALEPGRYYLQETKAPEKFKGLGEDTKIYFEVVIDPTVLGGLSVQADSLKSDTAIPSLWTWAEPEGEGENLTLNLTVKNIQQYIELMITKRADSGTTAALEDLPILAGAYFKLEKKVENSWEDVIGSDSISDSKGVVWFGGSESLELSLGETYRLTEIQAPFGYNNLGVSIEFMVVEDGSTGLGKIEILNEAELRAKFGDTWKRVVNVSDSRVGLLIQMQIVNNKGAELPETGGNGVYPYILGGLVFAFAAAFALIYKNKFRKAGF